MSNQFRKLVEQHLFEDTSKKYELIDERQLEAYKDGRVVLTKVGSGTTNERTLYSIRALRDFGDVKAGDFGGWIESEDNLSQAGDCWV